MKNYAKRLAEIERKTEPEKEPIIAMNQDEYDTLTPEQIAEIEAKYETLILIRYVFSDTQTALAR